MLARCGGLGEFAGDVQGVAREGEAAFASDVFDLCAVVDHDRDVLRMGVLQGREINGNVAKPTTGRDDAARLGYAGEANFVADGCRFARVECAHLHAVAVKG